MTAKRTYRCAIYTRKSTEEGLEKEFNSLDAQRDACAAYIRSQAGEGWKVVPAHYDDGGFTGANIDRPALQRLLADIDGGLVDVVVVYKIDRLTRSLADFAKIVERFDARGVSFVSITQSFNTTTSMGRLTLNVLLSFAQFEREVTAERIRDKIAASRAKGMWMGGGIPLGYDVRDRKLVINERDAKTVRLIFRRYLKLGSIGDLRDELDGKGINTKSRVSTKGRKSGGGRWYVGPLQHLLRNRVYVGDVVHKDKIYAGEHKPILPNDLFDRVQAKLDSSRTSWIRKRTIEASGLLTGLIKDDRGNAMTPQWSVGRNGKRHLYYVSQAHLQRRRNEAGSLPRIAAPIIEGLVMQLWRTVTAQGQVHTEGGRGTATSSHTAQTGHGAQERLRSHVRALTLNARSAIIEFDPSIGASKNKHEFGSTKTLDGASIERTSTALVVTVQLPTRHRGGSKYVENWTKDNWATETRRPDQRLVAALARAHRLRTKVELGEIKTIEALGAGVGVNRNDARTLLRLSFVAPDVQAAILEGRQPIGLSAKAISELDLPASWRRQRLLLGA
jgi:site-specific DNA recombinase